MITLLRSFLIRDRKGVAAIEFALLAPSFFMLMMAIFEIGYFIFMSTSTQRAVETAAYDLRTGHVFQEINERNISVEQWYRGAVCETVPLSGCSESIEISIEFYDRDMNVYWSSASAGELSAGAAGILMRVEVIFELPSIMFTELVFGNAATRMTTGMTFMTEPYA